MNYLAPVSDGEGNVYVAWGSVLAAGLDGTLFLTHMELPASGSDAATWVLAAF